MVRRLLLDDYDETWTQQLRAKLNSTNLDSYIVPKIDERRHTKVGNERRNEWGPREG